MKSILKVATAMLIALGMGGYAQAQAPQNQAGTGSESGAPVSEFLKSAAGKEAAAKAVVGGPVLLKLADQPSDKQAYFRSHPEQFTLREDGMVEMKAVAPNTTPMAATEATPTVKKEGEGLPAGYPRIVDTGNPKEDHAQYDKAKAAWIAANPAAYAAMNETEKGDTKAEKANTTVTPPAEQPMGIGKAAPMEPPVNAIVQTHEGHVSTPEEKANAAKSLEQHEKNKGASKPSETEAVRAAQPTDAVDPNYGKAKE